MTDKEKLERIKSLADDMYNKMAYLTSDTRPIRKAMENYKHFIIHEYYKEAYMPNELDTIKVREMMVVPEPNPRKLDGLSEEIMHLSKQFPEVSFAKLSRIAVRVARWQKQKMMKGAIETTLSHGLEEDYGINGNYKAYIIIEHED